MTPTGKSVEEMAREIKCKCNGKLGYSLVQFYGEEQWIYACSKCHKQFTPAEITAKYKEMKGEEG